MRTHRKTLLGQVYGGLRGGRLKKEMPEASVTEKAEKTFPASWGGGKYESGT